MTTDDTRTDDFARELNEARIRAHLSIRAAARLVDVPAATAQGWFSGKHYPTPALRPQYEQLATILGLELPAEERSASIESALSILREHEAPYAGLRPYAVDDAQWFFGRDAEAQRIARLVADAGPGISIVLGPSGAGKSSLLAAGVLGRERQSGGVLDGWSCAWLRADELGSADVTADIVVVDQFEEALDEPNLDEVVERLADMGRRCAVVLAVRSDAFSACSDIPELVPALQRPILITPMREAELREVIEGPAGVLGVRVESGLVERLLRDLSAGRQDGGLAPGALPLLSNTLLATWATGRSDGMTLADYESTGGLPSAIEALAEGALNALPAEDHARARSLFLALVRLDGDRVDLARLSMASVEDAERAVVASFVAARILTVDNDTLRISHASLVRY